MIWSNLVAGSALIADRRRRRHPVGTAAHVGNDDLVAEPVHLEEWGVGHRSRLSVAVSAYMADMGRNCQCGDQAAASVGICSHRPHARHAICRRHAAFSPTAPARCRRASLAEQLPLEKQPSSHQECRRDAGARMPSRRATSCLAPPGGRDDRIAEHGPGMGRTPIRATLCHILGHHTPLGSGLACLQWYCSSSTCTTSGPSRRTVMHHGPLTCIV